MSTLGLDHVSHAFDGVPVLRDVSLEVGRDEVVCLVGPSGCGKTTLLRIAAGVEPLRAGTVRIDGRVVAGPGIDVPPERRGVGMVFQDYALFPHLDVLGNAAFGLRGMAPAARRARAMDALGQVGMAAFAGRYPHNLSGGQQQRVGLARALAPRPRILLLDEPFSGLDTQLRMQLRDETLHMLRVSGVATVMVTHDPAEAMYMADRIAVMRDGQLVQVGAPETLYNQPVDGFVAGLFGYVNRFAGVVADGAVAIPFGPVAAPRLAAGAEVDVLIRPEAVRLAPEGEAPPGALSAGIVASRYLGRSYLVHLTIEDADGAIHHVHSQIRPSFDLAGRDRVHAWLEGGGFVFERLPKG
ncbi:MAG: ABC transporter ATP-binding protein [Alphaproteobacteria bacterium]